MKQIDSIYAFYEALHNSGDEGIKAQIVLLLRNWFNEVFDFDPRSGQSLALGMDSYFYRTAKYRNTLSEFQHDTLQMGMYKDRTYRIVDHVDEALYAILRQIRTKIVREYPVMPLYAVREIDSKTIQWLSKKPGRNVREKLRGRPYIKAVKRKNSSDTSENRLFKSFLTDLVKILAERENIFSIENDKLCSKVLLAANNWLKSEFVLNIGSWKNLEPNNVLLNDLSYRKIWDAWLWLQKLDEQVRVDFKILSEDILYYLYVSLISKLIEDRQLRVLQQPLQAVSSSIKLLPVTKIKGYLFFDSLPPCRSVGIVSSVHSDTDKGFGFITTKSHSKLYFHESYLTDSGDFKMLKTGDRVSFSIGSDNQGECASKITVVSEPRVVNFTLDRDEIVIKHGKKRIVVNNESDGYSVSYGNSKKKQLYDYSVNSCNRCIDAMYTRITGKTPNDLEYCYEQNISDSINSEFAVIDLYSIRPQYSVDGGATKNLPFRLLMQYWLSDVEDYVAVDCSYSKAIKIHSEVQSISMRSLFSKDETSSQAFKRETTLILIRKINEYLMTGSLYYLVPDWINDFELKNIRKQINFRYEYSSPIPKSIAAILAWQSSKKFDVDKLRVNDFVLVIDLLNNGISITPVKGLHNSDLKEIVPKTGGFFWERHPTQIFRSKKFASLLNRKLSQDGCPYSEELFNLFGYDGLAGDDGSLSIVAEAKCYHLHLNHNEMLPDDYEIASFLKEVVNQSVDDIFKNNKDAGVYLLPLNSLLEKVETRKRVRCLDSYCSIIDGAEKLLEWQKEAGKVVLWKDHLPNLAFDNIPQQITQKFFWWGKFYLVENTTLIPQRGKQFSIQVKENFTLPAGKTHYRFPLLQGEGSNELQFVAYLKSSAFPLKEDVTCKLHMTFTYGSDDPYELRFIPLNTDTAGFKSVAVEWRSTDNLPPIDLLSLPVPPFPPRKTWADFQSFPKKDSTEEFSDLLDWCTSKLKNLDKIVTTNIEQEFEGIVNRRKVGWLEWGSHDREGKYCCMINVEREKVFCRNQQFIETPDEKTLYEKCPVYLDIDTDRNELYCYNVSFSENIPIQLDEKYHSQITSRIAREFHLIEKDVFHLRFHVLTIWNNGHSLSNPGIPLGFKNTIRNAMKTALTILKSEHYPESLKSELFFFLSCLCNDAPSYIGERLLEIVRDKRDLKYFYRNVAFAIGDAELPWQTELFYSSLDLINSDRFTQSISLEILAIAFWRSRGLVSKLTEKQIKIIISNLIVLLKFGAELMISDIPEHRMQYHLNKGLSEDEAVDREIDYRVATLCKHLELLLALLRTRDSKDKRIKNSLTPNRAITKQYVVLIDRITRIFVDNDIEFRSRINLQVDKLEMFQSSPDLLHALRMYLTGDSVANTIVITGVDDES